MKIVDKQTQQNFEFWCFHFFQIRVVIKNMHHGGDSELYVSAKAKQLTEIDNATHFQQPNLKIIR